jgi:hypothetical protein
MVVGESEDLGPQGGLACWVIWTNLWYADVDAGEIIQSVRLIEEVYVSAWWCARECLKFVRAMYV